MAGVLTMSLRAFASSTSAAALSIAAPVPSVTPMASVIIVGRNNFHSSAKSASRSTSGAHHSVPELDAVLRQFMKQVHPDRFIRYPQMRKHNEQAVQEFLGFLDELKCVQSTEDFEMTSPFPARRRHRIEFYAPGDKAGQFKKVAVSIRTTGGDCRNVVEKSLLDLFAQCGIKQNKFTWGKKYWQPRIFENA